MIFIEWIIQTDCTFLFFFTSLRNVRNLKVNVQTHFEVARSFEDQDQGYTSLKKYYSLNTRSNVACCFFLWERCQTDIPPILTVSIRLKKSDIWQQQGTDSLSINFPPELKTSSIYPRIGRYPPAISTLRSVETVSACNAKNRGVVTAI